MKYSIVLFCLVLGIFTISCERSQSGPDAVADNASIASSEKVIHQTNFSVAQEKPIIRIYSSNGSLIKEIDVVNPNDVQSPTVSKESKIGNLAKTPATTSISSYTYVTPQFGIPNGQQYPNTYLSIVAEYNNTIVQFGNDQYSLSAGQLVTATNSFYGGTVIVSNYPIQACVQYVTMGGWSRAFSLPPYHKCGMHYRMPWISGIYSNNYLTVSAFDYNTTVWVGGTPYYLSPNYPILIQVYPQVTIISDKPVAAYAWANEHTLVRSVTLQALDN